MVQSSKGLRHERAVEETQEGEELKLEEIGEAWRGQEWLERNISIFLAASNGGNHGPGAPVYRSTYGEADSNYRCTSMPLSRRPSA